MSHDFAKKPRPNKKKEAAPKRQIPAWIWLFSGIAIGVFISFLAFLADITPDPSVPAPLAQRPADADATADQQTTATRFDFYTLLPEREVIVPTDKNTDKSEPREAVIYILQAGSFRKLADADRLRAQLILMGYDTNVDAVSSKGGDLWHRVQIGPFQSRSALAKARSRLINKGIDTLLLRRKAES